jgi:hypothetical protein
MFAQSSALLFFVTQKLTDGEPFERLLEFALVRSDHASKRGRELGAHCDFSFAFISEVEKLIDDFCAALFLVQLGRFEKGAVPLKKAIAPRDFAPAPKDVIAHRAIVRKKIAKTWKCLHKHHATLFCCKKGDYAHACDRRKRNLRYQGIAEKAPPRRGWGDRQWRTSIQSKQRDKYETNEISENIDGWNGLRGRAGNSAGAGDHDYYDNDGPCNRDHYNSGNNNQYCRHNRYVHSGFGLLHVPDCTGCGTSALLLHERHDHR